ncbi:hypothetical protein KKF82_05425 [Patescibacteria group bacterium]|nr:hypothetical protein [Patescibacteria group bacterium]
MTEEKICEMICDNLKDEHEAQPTYMKLVNALKEDAYPEEAMAIEKLIVADEHKHEQYLKILNQSHECSCK